MNELDWLGHSPQNEELVDTEEEIFQYIVDKVATYPQEIATELGHSLHTVQHHLRRMYKDQRVGILQTPYNHVPDRIMFRLAELQMQGISGVDIQKRTWYCANETGAQLRERLYLEGRVATGYDPERLRLFLR